MRAFLYIVSSSRNPDYVECPVPFAIDEDEIFFGPCKKGLRRNLRNRLLARDRDVVTPDEDLYLVGFNGGTSARKRKVVWAGGIKRVMTFARAWDELVGPRYEPMRNCSDSPLLLEPIRGDDGRLLGYRHATQLHEGRWIEDLTSSARGSYRVTNQTEIRVADGCTPWDVFERDACLVLENAFFASGSGIDVDGEIVAILRAAQRRTDIDSYAVFGLRKDGSADGKTGSWLEIEGDLAQQLILAIKKRARTLKPAQESLSNLETRRRCHPAGSGKNDIGQPTQPPPPLRRRRTC